MAFVEVPLAGKVHYSNHQSNHGIFAHLQIEKMSRKTQFPIENDTFSDFSNQVPFPDSICSNNTQDNGRLQVHRCVCVRICAFTLTVAK